MLGIFKTQLAPERVESTRVDSKDEFEIDLLRSKFFGGR